MAAHSIRLLNRLRAWRAELPLVGLWAGALVGIELLGRGSRSEATDAIGVAVLVTLALFTAGQHAARPHAAVNALLGAARRIGQRLGQLRLSVGIDLREDPPLPRRLPPLLVRGVLAAALAPIALLLVRGALPGGLREALLTLSPSLLAVYLVVLWSTLGLGALVLYMIPLIYLGEAMERSPRWRPQRRRLSGWLGAGYALMLAVAGSTLPSWTPLALAGLALVGFLGLGLLPPAPRLWMLWKRPGTDGPPARFQWSWLTCGLDVVHLGVASALVLLARGDALAGAGGGATPISHLLGAALGWCFLGAYVVELQHAARVLLLGRGDDPARPRAPRVFVDGAEGTLQRGRARKALERGGFDVAFPGAPRERTDVRLVLEDAPPAGAEAWPRAVTQAALEDPGLHAKLRRRWEQVCRRALLRGVERAFKGAARQRYDKGSGFWVAPHYWFVTHLSRDVDEDVSGLIGEPWRRLVPAAARHHLHVVLRDLELDLLFVEDGVRYRELKRVLALLFEHHDIFGGARLEDLRLFAGLPRLRVMLHEYVLEHPFRASGYPEPDYEDLGRARILHVYRDRGGEEQLAPTPREFDWTPEPVAPLGA